MKQSALSFVTLMAVFPFTLSLPCPNLCNMHGSCDLVERECRCFKGYTGADCSRRVCPKGKAWGDIAIGTDNAHNDAVCSNMGLCDFISGTCACFEGFTGKACERSVCPNHCNFNGKCMSMSRIAREFGLEYSNWDSTKMWGCHCDDGWTGYDCSLRTCPTGDDPLTIDQKLEKQLVVLYLANDLPLEKSGKKNVDAMDHTHTYFTLSYKGKVTRPIYCDDNEGILKQKLEELSTINTVNIRFLDRNNRYMCGTDIKGTKKYQFVSIEFVLDFGDLPPLQVYTRAGNLGMSEKVKGEQDQLVRTVCKTNDIHPYPRVVGPYPKYSNTGVGIKHLGCDLTSAAKFAHSGLDANLLIPVVGTKEEAVCSGRGLCNHKNGLCECSYNFESSDGYGENAKPGGRGECGYKVGPVVSCPGELVTCSGHGVCSNDPEYVCTCDKGWQAADCSLRTCPSGKAWFDASTSDNVAHEQAECSNKGVCNRETGICTCHAGFTGKACQRLRCNMVLAEDLTLGGEWLEPGVECNGHGQCLPMQDLAHYALINGVPTDYTYGATPNNPKTWDYDVVHSCLCDKGWEGADCSMRSCPTGDNPDSPGLREIQRFSCNRVIDKEPQFLNVKTNKYEYDNAAGFTLGFRECTTKKIPYNAKMSDIEDALEATACIRDVKVEYLYRLDVATGNKGSTSATFDPNLATGKQVPAKAAQIACGDGGEQRAWWLVTFVSEVGDLPLTQMVEVKQAKIDDPHISFNFAEHQGATTENEICSLRGVCDYTKGECSCFAGWGSSDGLGSEGSLEDCGWRIPSYGKHYLSKFAMNDEDRIAKQVEQMSMKLWDKYNYKN